MYNFEQIGFIPRSIIRTLKRFFKQISLKTDLFVIYEFRVSRYIAIACEENIMLNTIIVLSQIYEIYIFYPKKPQP